MIPDSKARQPRERKDEVRYSTRGYQNDPSSQKHPPVRRVTRSVFSDLPRALARLPRARLDPSRPYQKGTLSIPARPLPFATGHPGRLPPAATVGSPSARRYSSSPIASTDRSFASSSSISERSPGPG